MKKLLRDTAVTLIGVILCSNMAVSDVVKGQKIYLKKMKSKCAISGSEFAGNIVKISGKRYMMLES